MGGAYEGGIYLDEVVATPPRNTPAGSNVSVSRNDVTITYETVEDAGNTEVTESSSGPALARFRTSCRPVTYYDITTTANYSGTIEVCIHYDDTACDESDLRLLHRMAGVWVDVTTSLDTTANIICGQVTSLSDFVLGSPIEVTDCPDIHVTTADNIPGIGSHRTVIDHRLTNGHPDAIILATQNWNPGGMGGTYNDASIGVWYNGSEWEIFNQGFDDMPVGAAFNFKVVPPSESVFIHAATAASITSNWTVIDHPLTNGNPDALLFVTQNWNPGGGAGVDQWQSRRCPVGDAKLVAPPRRNRRSVEQRPDRCVVQQLDFQVGDLQSI